MRIVSLLPSATDIVVALGAADSLVGVSHSCGADWSHLPALTSTRIDTKAASAEIDAQVKTAAEPLYDLDIERLEQLAPDVVVSQSLCDVCAVASGDVEEAVKKLSSRPDLVNLAPFGLADIPQGFEDVGQALNLAPAARKLVADWEAQLASYAGRYAQQSPRIAFLDWLDPPFAAGHWIPDILELLGCVSTLAQPGEPSHEVTWAKVAESQPELVIAACCGFSQERATQDPTPQGLAVHLLDGYENFSRPSPRLLDSLPLLDALLTQQCSASQT